MYFDIPGPGKQHFLHKYKEIVVRRDLPRSVTGARPRPDPGRSRLRAWEPGSLPRPPAAACLYLPLPTRQAPTYPYPHTSSLPNLVENTLRPKGRLGKKKTVSDHQKAPLFEHVYNTVLSSLCSKPDPKICARSPKKYIIWQRLFETVFSSLC